MVRVEMGTDEQINITGVQAKLCKLLQYIFPHDGHWHSRRGLHLTGQTTINQNVGAVAGLNEIADEREVPLRDGCYLYQIEPLWCSTVRVHMIILSLWPKHCLPEEGQSKSSSPGQGVRYSRSRCARPSLPPVAC